ncbi:tetratricopeptide repeat protein [Streptomyces sp. NBC_01477]|uniref:tetratricopeptide repeat protein n=1 Tax=Streptomyces sp. NBC_01477 TaxID=2976015 RepID=UPI002E35474D|nr:tetratricopeptide repeat protein [Streptomyces sp. NBC_01477]
MDGHAEDDGRVYQASGDQHISEHHHYGSAPATPAGPDSVRRPTVGRTPVVLRDRTDVLERLRTTVASGPGGEIYVLHGMGGCGKTAVAHAFFQVATTEYGRAGLWVNAADRASLRAGMLAVAADRSAGDGELLAARNGYRPAADLVWHYLDRSAEPWLLVLDNADDPSILGDGSWLRTSPRGTVLVTTRRAAPRWWPGAELQHIGVLPREDAARVLHDLAPHTGTLAQAAEIADRLGRLPLALTLAGGFLRHQIMDPWTMDVYGRHLEEDQGVQLIDRGADVLSDADPRHLVGQTWQLTLDAFAARGLPEAVGLLRLIARLAPEPLPLSVLNDDRISAVLPHARAESALRALLDHSLTELVGVGDNGSLRCVRSHAVLLDSVRSATPAAETALLDTTAGRLLGAALPDVPDAGPNDPRLRLLAPHVLALLRRTAEPATVAQALEVATRLATALHRTGDYPSARETAGTAADLAARTLGGEHRAVLAARSRAGRALFRLGRYSEAEELLQRTLAVQQLRAGADDQDSLDTAHGLQLVLRNVGRAEESLSLLYATAAGRQATLGPWHPLTLRSRSSLLSALDAAELTAEDRRTQLLSLPQQCAEHLGADHTVSVGARHNHAWASYQLGLFPTADAEIREVTETYSQRFGPDYPIALAACQLQARTRAALGHTEEGVALMTDVVARRARSLGRDHPFTVASRDLLDALRSGHWQPPRPQH